MEIDLTGLDLLDWREGDVTAADTETALTTKGDVSSPGALKVTGTIKKIIIAAHTDGAATGGCNGFVRLRGGGGKALDIPFGAMAGGTLAAGASHQVAPVVYTVSLAWNGEMLIFAECPGADSGTVPVSVFLYGTPS